jgi:hypothetical protein
VGGILTSCPVLTAIIADRVQAIWPVSCKENVKTKETEVEPLRTISDSTPVFKPESVELVDPGGRKTMT